MEKQRMIEAIIHKLFATLRPISDLPVQHGAGVYILCLRPGSILPGVTPANEGLLYVGMTDDDLNVRNHFMHVDSGRSSPRRSLGAMLRTKLLLEPIPRNGGRHERDATHFRFTDGGERDLIDWMRDHLMGSQLVIEVDVDRCEGDLIRELMPPLNLTKLGGWKNPQKATVMGARKGCADLARKA